MRHACVARPGWNCAVLGRPRGLVGHLAFVAETLAVGGTAVEVYKSETREVIRRFLDHRLSFPDFIVTLDAARADLMPDLMPRLRPEDRGTLHAVMLFNNERVNKEMERRGLRGGASK